MPRNDITLEEIFETSEFSGRANHYKIFPGKVTAYYPPVQGQSPAMVDVAPAVNDVRFDTVLGTRISEPWPILPKIPVSFMQGGGYSIVFPLTKGDKVTLLSYDLDPTKHRGTGNVEDPIDTGRHRGAYWVAIPGDITDVGAGPDPGSSLVVGIPNGSTLEIAQDGSIKLGAQAPSVAIAGGTQPVARGPDPINPLVTGDTVNAGYLVLNPAGDITQYFPGTAVGKTAAQTAAQSIMGTVVPMEQGTITGGSSKVTSG